MSGPSYPRPNPAPGSNIIGEFQTGVSPIGTIAPFDVWNTIISQYANSPIITAMLTAFNSCLDFTADFDAFFDMIWNVDTAQGIGLDIWGRIVGVVRTVYVPGTQKYLGFEEATSISADPWNQSPFFIGNPLTSNFQLSDDSFRLLILAKALANISDGSIKSINALLRSLFPGRGNCYVVDGLNMTMQYFFHFILSPVELAVLSQSGVLPKPVGVSATIVQG